MPEQNAQYTLNSHWPSPDPGRQPRLGRARWNEITNAAEILVLLALIEGAKFK
jgi:hypothetical protein